MIEHFLDFYSDAGRRLIELNQLIEVIPMVWLQREADDIKDKKFCGLLNYRGSIVPVFTLERYSKKLCENPEHFLVVAHCDKGDIAIVAQQVDSLLAVKSEQCKSIDSASGRPIKVVNLDNQPLRVLNLAEFFSL